MRKQCFVICSVCLKCVACETPAAYPDSLHKVVISCSKAAKSVMQEESLKGCQDSKQVNKECTHEFFDPPTHLLTHPLLLTHLAAPLIRAHVLLLARVSEEVALQLGAVKEFLKARKMTRYDTKHKCTMEGRHVHITRQFCCANSICDNLSSGEFDRRSA